MCPQCGVVWGLSWEVGQSRLGMATSNAGVVYDCPAKNVLQKMCNVSAK